MRLYSSRDRLVEAGRREVRQQVRDAHLHQVDAGGLQRLEEAAGQADRDDVPVPRLLAPPGLEAQRARLGQRRAVEVAQQDRGGLVLAHVLAGEHVAVADAVLQRDAPLPAGLARGRARVRRAAPAPSAQGTATARSHGSQCDQSSKPVLSAPSISSAAEARAVDEQVALDHLARLQRDRRRRGRRPRAAARSVMRPSTRLTPRCLGILAQVARVQRWRRSGTHSGCATAATWACPCAAA